MDKLTFEKYINYRPKATEHMLYWVMVIIYIISFMFSMFISWKYFSVLQNYMYNKNNDVIFSMYASGIFSLSFFFISLVLNGIIIWKIFSKMPFANNAIIWYEVAGSKTFDYNVYKRKNKRNNIFIIITVIIALFFLFTSLFVHLRINNSGIYYNRIFEYKEKYYSWNELKSVSFILKVTKDRKSRNLSPEMVLEFGENKIDIWDGAGLGSPNSETLINTINLINENTNIEFIIDNNFTDEIIDLLYNKSTKWKRDNIIDVFNYLKK
jgi:hypothetical protein